MTAINADSSPKILRVVPPPGPTSMPRNPQGLMSLSSRLSVRRESKRPTVRPVKAMQRQRFRSTARARRITHVSCKIAIDKR